MKFLTLENVQVDCTELTEEQINEMCNVYESNGYEVDWVRTNVSKHTFTFLRFDVSDVWCSNFDENKTTITYEKFMELFGEPQYEVKYIAEQPKEEKPKHYSKGIDTFARMEANCTTEECLAFAKGNIDKYNWREKGQDLEDYKKIIAYAQWAIKLLEK